MDMNMAKYVLFLIKALNEAKVIADLLKIINEHNHGHSGWAVGVNNLFYVPQTISEEVLSYRLFQALLNCAERFKQDVETAGVADVADMINLVQKLLKYDSRQIGRHNRHIISNTCFMLQHRIKELNATNFEKLDFSEKMYLPFPDDLFHSSRRQPPKQYYRLYQIFRNGVRDLTEEEIDRMEKYRQKNKNI